MYKYFCTLIFLNGCLLKKYDLISAVLVAFKYVFFFKCSFSCFTFKIRICLCCLSECCTVGHCHLLVKHMQCRHMLLVILVDIPTLIIHSKHTSYRLRLWHKIWQTPQKRSSQRIKKSKNIWNTTEVGLVNDYVVLPADGLWSCRG